MFFKFTVAFFISFVVLSFNINQKTIFDHMTEIAGPLGNDVQRSLNKSVNRSISKSKKIFKNADPKLVNDSIRSSQSSTSSGKIDELILEDIKRDEARKLDEMIKKN